MLSDTDIWGLFVITFTNILLLLYTVNILEMETLMRPLQTKRS